MLNYIRKNAKVISKNTLIKVIRNNDKCPYCNTKNYIDIKNNIINCVKCNQTFNLFEYVEEKENIQKDNYDIFLSKNSKPNNAFI
jgi:ribosomal protein L37AE/L43A